MADLAALIASVETAAALAGAGVWLWRRGARPDQEPPVDEWGDLAVARSERRAAELAELRRTVARQRAAIDDMAAIVVDAGLTVPVNVELLLEAP